MLGPVQLVMIGFPNAELPADVRHEVEELVGNPSVRLLDAEILTKERGQISRRAGGFTLQDPAPAGEIIERMLTKATSASVLSDGASPGQGFINRPDPVPDPTRDLPDDANVLVLLLEHQWANPLWSSARENGARPLADAWVGRQPLADAGLEGVFGDE